jgi:DNA-binding MarR family transcriptional regulator
MWHPLADVSLCAQAQDASHFPLRPLKIEFARHGHIHPHSAVVALIALLERVSWNSRERSTDDRRWQGLSPIPAGLKSFKALRKEMVEHERRFVERFTDGELRTLIALLRRLHS